MANIKSFGTIKLPRGLEINWRRLDAAITANGPGPTTPCDVRGAHRWKRTAYSPTQNRRDCIDCGREEIECPTHGTFNCPLIPCSPAVASSLLNKAPKCTHNWFGKLSLSGKHNFECCVCRARIAEPEVERFTCHPSPFTLDEVTAAFDALTAPSSGAMIAPLPNHMQPPSANLVPRKGWQPYVPTGKFAPTPESLCAHDQGFLFSSSETVRCHVCKTEVSNEELYAAGAKVGDLLSAEIFQAALDLRKPKDSPECDCGSKHGGGTHYTWCQTQTKA